MYNKYTDIINILYNKNLSAVGRYYYLKQLNYNSIDMLNISNMLTNKTARGKLKKLQNEKQEMEIDEYIKEKTMEEIGKEIQRKVKDMLK